MGLGEREEVATAEGVRFLFAEIKTMSIEAGGWGGLHNTD